MPNLQQKPIIKSLIGIDIEEYIEKLKVWLIENQCTYFSDPEYHAVSYYDFSGNKTIQLAKRNLCMPDELMLIDRGDKNNVHTYTICSINKNNKCKDHYYVLPISQLSGEHWRNGYFLLPNLQQYA